MPVRYSVDWLTRKDTRILAYEAECEDLLSISPTIENLTNYIGELNNQLSLANELLQQLTKKE